MKKPSMIAMCASLMLGTCSGSCMKQPAEHYEARWLEIQKMPFAGFVELVRKIDLLDAEIPDDYKDFDFYKDMMYHRQIALS